jgi:alpha-ribazole phosphatase
MEVYLIRHTAPLIEKGICYGQSDVPLASSFLEEFRTLKKLLPEQFDVVYSSPLSRCIELAKLLKQDDKIIIDDRILEINFGSWELMKWDDIEQNEFHIWMDDFVNIRVPSGENFQDLYNRAMNFVDELAKKKYQTVAVVTHSGVIRSILSGIQQFPIKDAINIPCEYGSFKRIQL